MSRLRENVSAAIRRHGHTGVLRRRVGTTSTFISVTTRYLPSTQSDVQLAGLMAQGDMLVDIDVKTVLAASWPLPIKSNDLYEIDGKSWRVEGAFPLHVFNDLVGYQLHLRGG